MSVETKPTEYICGRIQNTLLSHLTSQAHLPVYSMTNLRQRILHRMKQQLRFYQSVTQMFEDDFSDAASSKFNQTVTMLFILPNNLTNSLTQFLNLLNYFDILNVFGPILSIRKYQFCLEGWLDQTKYYDFQLTFHIKTKLIQNLKNDNCID